MFVSAKKFITKIILSVFFLFVLFLSHTALAAQLSLSPSSGSYNVGDTIKVRIVLSSSDQSANAVSGSLTFSKDVLSMTSVSKSDSLVSLWALDPAYSNANGTVDMEGVILNGYTGGNGTILTLFFRAKSIGTANIKFSSSSVLANDGQGTNILSSSGQASFNIAQAVVKEKVVAPPPVVVENNTPSITIQEIKKKDMLDPHSSFLITSTGKKSKAPYSVEIDSVAYPWDDQTSGIFETSLLANGPHSIKVYADGANGSIISNSLSFNISALMIPIFTDYSKEIAENEFAVVKGIADPSLDILIDSERVLPDGSSVPNESVTVKSNDKGLFTYVSENRSASGMYIVTAQARSSSGVLTDKSLPVKISVKAKTTSVSVNIINILSAVIPIVALLLMLILTMVWGWHHILHYREYIKKRLKHTGDIVAKSFDILGEEVAEEVKIFKKIKALQPLTANERNLINQLQKDMEVAEKTIITDIKESEK